MCLATVLLLILLSACEDTQLWNSDLLPSIDDKQANSIIGSERSPEQTDSNAESKDDPEQTGSNLENKDDPEQTGSNSESEETTGQNISRSAFINQFLSTAIGSDIVDVGGGLFISEDEITRYDAIVIISSALKLQRNAAPNFKFTDEDAISDISYVYAAYNAGIITGFEDGAFRPDDKLTNEESSAIMENITIHLTDDEEMGLEVERKFLVNTNNIPYDLSRATVSKLVQTYINISPEIRVRQTNGSRYTFTVKLPHDDIGLARQEVGFDISQDEYEVLFKKKIANPIEKTRYRFVSDSGNVVYLDIYSGHLEGLAVAEIEFYNVEAASKFVPFDWFIRDLTADDRYKNVNLALYGFPQ